MRKEFEKLPEIADSLSEHIYFGGDGFYHSSLVNFQGLVNWLNGAWYAWQAAKAQAVQEGFVLVSKNELKMELRSIRDLNNGEHSNSIIEDCVCNIEAMIEAQEQNQ